MQSVSSRIWTRVAVFISYDDNHYTRGTSLKEDLKVITSVLMDTTKGNFLVYRFNNQISNWKYTPLHLSK